MSFVIWYRVDISAAGLPPVVVSNDVLAGGLVVDAEIVVTMTEGAATDTFEITLVNLPMDVAELIGSAQATTAVHVDVRLGYFDEPATRVGDGGLVLAGRLTRITGRVEDDGFSRVVLSGQEKAGYALRNTRAVVARPGRTTAAVLAADLLRSAQVPVATGSTLPGDLTGLTVRSGSVLEALRTLADRAAVPLVVRDGRAYLGAAVGAPTDPAPVTFDPDANIVTLDSAAAEDTAGDLAPPVRSTLNLTVLGHPGLRVGQVARVTGLDRVPTGPLRLARVEHWFTTSGGYTARVALIAAAAGVRAQVVTGAQVVVDRWRTMTDRVHEDRPAVDVGEVTGYATGAGGKHLASLHYAQTPDPGVLAPSVGSPVDTAADLHEKPIASPFAFDRTGLIVPVYPGMRALLAHNRGAVNDAVLAGFLWPDNPLMRRPRNETGDYWLALPTGLDDEGRPTGAGVNDLTDAAGRRVIQAAGLSIQVGRDTLPEVGDRPAPPDDDTITIAHRSGTTITVDAAGAVTIDTSDSSITLTNGSVTLKLDGSSVAVS